ncbi:MAG: rhodanese-like domain-containing protein [Candidatus Limnocylindrales bacterium]
MIQQTPTVTVTEASDRLATTDQPAPLLVDVREQSEFGMLRVPGSVLMPLSTFTTRFEELPHDRPLLVMCAVGGRSARATEFLVANGYPESFNVAGGITAWNAAGLPVRTGPVEAGEGDLA